MSSKTDPRIISFMLLTALGFLLLVQYASFFGVLTGIWWSDGEFSYGILIPVVVLYLIWNRRSEIQNVTKFAWGGGLIIALTGGALHVLGSFSGILILSGFALSLSVIGISGFLWGTQLTKIVAGPLALLVLMVPLPAYVLGEISWYMKLVATSLSSSTLQAIGIPVFQDGNILRIPNFALEVREACSGTRSIFALLSLAIILGFGRTQKWWGRSLLILAAPVLAVTTNVVRIVGTGLLASQYGALAANESLHAVWGIVVFLMAVVGLGTFRRLLQCSTKEYVH